MKNKEYYIDLLEKIDKEEKIEALNEIEKEIEEDVKKADKIKKDKEKEAKNPKYKYPFIIHLAGRNLETDHIFEENKEYDAESIKTKMLEHQYYDFSGQVSFDYIKNENVLLPIFQQHKKG